MIPALNHPPTILVEHIDQRVRLHGISWEGHESFLVLRGEQSGVPGRQHCPLTPFFRTQRTFA